MPTAKVDCCSVLPKCLGDRALILGDINNSGGKAEEAKLPTGRRRNLGTFKTREAAEKHERAVQFFKRGH